MLNVKVYKNNSGEFQKTAIEFDDESLTSVFIRGILSEMGHAEKIVREFKDHDYLRKKHQEKFNQLEELLNKLDKPEIIKNEKAELIKRFKEMEIVYQTEDDYLIVSKL